MEIFNVVESLLSTLEPNNSEYFYKIGDILKELFLLLLFVMSCQKNWKYLAAMLILSQK